MNFLKLSIDATGASSGDGCDGETYMGRCDGDTVIWCENDRVYWQDCSAKSKACILDSSGAYYGCGTP